MVKASITDARCDRGYPPGRIGVISADLARYNDFMMSLCGIKYPYGTTLANERGCDIVSSCNKLVAGLLGSAEQWLWILGDDHVFGPDLLVQLLRHLYGETPRDLVAPLVAARQAPFPSVMGMIEEVPEKRIRTVLFNECTGVMPVDVVGSAGLLVHRRVFERMGSPWFRAGSIVATGLGEDWDFCRRANALGFPLVIDTTLRMGHTTSMTIWPATPAQDGFAGVLLDLGSNHAVQIRHEVAATPVLAEVAA
jgi:hypothetical protein